MDQSTADRLRALRWTLRRWTLKHCYYRARLPFRRRRWDRVLRSSCDQFAKSPAARPTAGSAIVFGAFASGTGLGRAAAYDLELVRARHSSVIAIDIAAALAGRASGPIHESPVENAYFLCQPDTYAVLSKVVSPNALAGAYRVGRWVWETPEFPGEWRCAEKVVHEVWAPSEFCARTFRGAISLPVEKRAYPVAAPKKGDLDIRKRFGVDPTAFLGVAIMDVVSCPDRKNPWDHVRAWQAAFGGDPSSVLLMKLRVGKRTRVVVDELRELAIGASNILIVVDELTDDEISALHHAADVFVSLHRSEGFGLNIYEALLLGKRVVATDYSANAEFGPAFPTYFGSSYRLAPYNDWLRHYRQSFDYALVDVLHAAEGLRQARHACRRWPEPLTPTTVAAYRTARHGPSGTTAFA